MANSLISSREREVAPGAAEAVFVFIHLIAPEGGWRDQGTPGARWFLREEEKSDQLTRAAKLSSSRAQDHLKATGGM